MKVEYEHNIVVERCCGVGDVACLAGGAGDAGVGGSRDGKSTICCAFHVKL